MNVLQKIKYLLREPGEVFLAQTYLKERQVSMHVGCARSESEVS